MPDTGRDTDAEIQTGNLARGARQEAAHGGWLALKETPCRG